MKGEDSMTNRQLKKKIREAFSHGTPDISQKIVIDTLFCEQQEQNGAELSVETERKPFRFRVFGITAAACAAIAVLAISINLIVNRSQSGSVDYISIDQALETVFAYPSYFPITGVTPTVEWELDTESATPHYDVTLTYGDSVAYQYVVDAVTGEILSTNSHQLPILGGYIYLTEEKTTEIALSAASVNASEITEYTCKREIIDAILHYHISFRVVNAQYHYKVNAVTGGIQDSYVLNASNFITRSSAKTIALATVKLTDSEITNYSIEFESDGKNSHYNIIFVSNNRIFHFKIDAVTGHVLDVSNDVVDVRLTAPSVVTLLPVEIPLSHAGVTLEDIVNLKCEEDTDADEPHIDISFIANGVKYEFDYKRGGGILDFKTKPMVEEFISLDGALTRVYKTLNMSPAQAPASLHWAFEGYEGRMCYGIRIGISEESVVEAKIDATTGEMLFWNEQVDDADTVPQPPDGRLTAQGATNIALSHLGLSSTDQVERFQLREDTDGEIPHYDVSFRYQGYQYTLEISMYDGGQILSVEKEALYGTTPD